jgi:hypothetical protein
MIKEEVAPEAQIGAALETRSSRDDIGIWRSDRAYPEGKVELLCASRNYCESKEANQQE